MNLTAEKCSVTGLWHIPELEHWRDTFAGMISNLKEGYNFKFARYGDGEIHCMRGRDAVNCDNHYYYPDLGAALRQTIATEPEYMVGIQPLSIGSLNQQVKEYFGHFQRLYNADVLHNASIERRIPEFFRALKGRYVILVGPYHLAGLFNDHIHIVIPHVDCWKQHEEIRQQIAFHIDGIVNPVVLLCASMMSEVLISEFEDAPATFIDCGSVFDPYVGVKSRKYHYKLAV